MSDTQNKPDKQLTGLCGEHYVAALLAGYELVVALPRGGAARADLFVADSSRGRALRVQVKSGRQAYLKYKRKYDGQGCFSWDIDRSIIHSHDEGLWFAFVSLGQWPNPGEPPPVAFFIPSSVLAKRLTELPEQKRSFFWSFESNLEAYRDAKGLQKLKNALGNN